MMNTDKENQDKYITVAQTDQSEVSERKETSEVTQAAEVIEEEATNAPTIEVTESETGESQEFNSFFNEVLKKIPTKYATTVVNSFDKSKAQAEKILANSKEQYEGIFEEFLVGVDPEVRKKCFSTIHIATLTAAIIGCSPIPFSDAVLLVPVQLTMMGRLHKLFGQSWTQNIKSAVTKEIGLVGFGRSAIGNLMKLVPVVGSVTGAAVNGVVASGLTASLGWVTVKMLNDGEDLFDDLTTFRGQFQMLSNAVKNSRKKA